MQAGGRRFDPDQLHQSSGAGARDQAVEEIIAKRPGFSSGFLSQGYRLFFNNWEEVKVLLEWAGHGASHGLALASEMG